MSGERLYSLVKNIAKKALPDENQADILYGVVKSIAPLKVEIENKFTLHENQVYLSPFCARKTFRLVLPPHTHSTDVGSTGPAGYDIEIELWRGLEVGDKLILLRHNKGQSFYALQRIEAVT